MRRGDVVLVALPGDYGKPRPAIVLQDDLLTASAIIESVIVCPLTSHLTEARSLRVPIAPNEANGVTQPSEAMVDKVASVRTARVRNVIGRIDATTIRDIERALLLVLGFASQDPPASS